ncbi:MAG: hypothetical protein M3400_09940, partial [Actinomycetota bacterium]|nr:hypothetical protein [Actinomycetota bacterium]
LEDAATRRYGPAWLSRASVAGLVTATMAGTAAVTATGAAATAAAPATAQTVAFGSTATPTTLAGQTAATAGRTGARILGMPLAAAVVALVLIVAAAAGATTVIVTNNQASTRAAESTPSSGPEEAGTDESSPSDSGDESDAVAILYSGTLNRTSGSVSETEQVQLGVACTNSGQCELVGLGATAGHDVFPLVRTGPGTFNAVLAGPGVVNCDITARVTNQLSIMISLDRAAMTLTYHIEASGPIDCPGGGSRRTLAGDGVFEGTYVSGDLPGL